MNNTHVINYKPPPLVNDFIASGFPHYNNVSLIVGPFGSGKTTGNIFKIIYHASRQEPSKVDGKRYTRWVVVRNTKIQLRDTTMKSFFEWFPRDDETFGIWREQDMTYTITMGDIRAEIMFRALDRPEDVQRVLSLQITGAYINELREIDQAIFTDLRSRCGRYPNTPDLGKPTWHGLFADSNSYDEDHWLYDVFDTNLPVGWTFINQPSGLAPNAENRENLEPRYYEDLMQGAKQSWVDVHIHNKRGTDKTGRAVYEETYDKTFHVSSIPLTPRTDLPIFIGLDLGRTPAAIIKQQLPNGQILTLEEVIGDNIGLNRFLNDKLLPVLTSRYPLLPVIVAPDPAAYTQDQLIDLTTNEGYTTGLTGIIVLEQKGFKVAPKYLLTNNIDIRIAAVEMQMSRTVKTPDGIQSAYLIDPLRCKTLIRGFARSYKYRIKRDGERENKPLKNEYSHIHDANQYVDMIIGKVSLEDFGYLPGGKQEIELISMSAWG